MAGCACAVLAGCVTPPAVVQTGTKPSATPHTQAQAAAPTPSADAIDSNTTIKIAALRNWTAQQDRLYQVAAPLLIKNAALCKRQARHLLGFTAKTKYSYSAELADAAQAGIGLDERLRVMNVLPGSGAEQSGLQRDDILLAVDNKPLPQGAKADHAAGEIISKAMKNRNSLKLALLRGAERIERDVALTHACAFGIELGNSDDINSYSDGYRVMITRGMLNFARSEEELAYVLAKEIAHAILARQPRPRMRAVIDNLQSPAASDADTRRQTALPPYSPVLDATADKLSLYLLARAGYPIDNAVVFWKRLAAQYPGTIAHGHTALHPSTAYRASVMTQVLQRLKFKMARNQPLLP